MCIQDVLGTFDFCNHFELCHHHHSSASCIACRPALLEGCAYGSSDDSRAHGELQLDREHDLLGGYRGARPGKLKTIIGSLPSPRSSQASTDEYCASTLPGSSSVDSLASYDGGVLDALLDLASMRLQAISEAAAVAAEEKARRKAAKAETKTEETETETEERPFMRAPGLLAEERPTKIMLGRLPGSFTRARLEALLDQEGFAGLYDFTYVPMDFRTRKLNCFAFVNLVDGDAAVACKDAFDGYALQAGELTTAWASSLQGLQANVLRYRDSPVMHESVPDHFKPALFYRGAHVDFPAPTSALKTPPRSRIRGAAPPQVPSNGGRRRRRLLTRWRAAGAIALQTRNYEVYHDCLAPSGASTTAPRGPPESSAPDPLCDSMSGVLIGSAIF